MRPFRTAVPPLHFFALTFLLSWLIWIPLALSRFGIGPIFVPEGISALVRLLGVLMPAASALVLTARLAGRDGLHAVLSRLGIWRVDLRWWVVAALVQPLLLLVAGLASGLLPGNAAVAPAPIESLAVLAVNVVFLLLATLGEEIGWRGVALPALQQRTSPFKASLILGLVWTMWHLPFWVLLDSFSQFGPGYLVLNALLILPSNAYITWFFNHGRYSLLLPVAFHLTFNIVNTALLPVTSNIGAFVILIALEWAIAVPISPHLESEQTKLLRTTSQ